MNLATPTHPNPTTAPAVEILGLEKWYENFHALHDVNLCVEAGQKVVICGPSGSGKSTLIRCINYLEKTQEGVIRVNGLDLGADGQGARAIRNDVGMVFQQFNLFPHLTVLENCVLAQVRTKGLSKRDAEMRAQDYLAKVRVAEQASKYPAQLSGGQQQRVAIARALCLQPKIMLFDEPTSALDPEMVKEVLDTMIALASEGMTMICVTHEMGFARAVADEVIFMDAGRIVERAAPAEFFANPSHERTRTFLGQILNH